MGIKMRTIVSLLVLFSFTVLLPIQTLAAKKSYVVYLGAHSPNTREEAAVNSHHELLGSILKSKEKAKDAIFYSYTKEINGFAANMEEHEANELSKHPSVVSVFPNKPLKLHTTHTWQFLGLEKYYSGEISESSLWKKARFGEDVIIATLDTGVWPESESFREDGMGPTPSRWKGVCDNGVDKTFNCNKKLIGARYFNKGFRAALGNKSANITDSPRDTEGHGSHTLSTAAGAFVPGANYYGYANGTAKGGSSHARVATYKVCWPSDEGGCFDSDTLAAFDAAIHDRVDVISMSVGGPPLDYFMDSIAIGSFHAVKKGITVVCSGGNEGPIQGTVSNLAPWIITVGASTLDRVFPSYLVYNGKVVKGMTFSKSLPRSMPYPMINSLDAKAKNATEHDANLCLVNSLDHEKVKGKIVVCLRGEIERLRKSFVVQKAGGAGMILVNQEVDADDTVGDPHFVPTINIGYSDGLELYSYLNSSKSPQGYILCGRTKFGKRPSPTMAPFSSVGPNVVNPEILKPDITAPGVDVLAAFSSSANLSAVDFDTRKTPFVFMSGTSMSCPHIGGVVGLLKTLNPSWSPAMIKSAIMTTATILHNTMEPIKDRFNETATALNYGAGHVKPNALVDPGLVYDMTPKDYLNFLCSIGYNKTMIGIFSGEYSCPSKQIKPEDLNYPSISIASLSGTMTVTRTVKNVGLPSKYSAIVSAPKGVSVTVEPAELEFEKFGEEKQFQVTMEANEAEAVKGFTFGSLEWSDGIHHVRSPLVVYI